MLHVVPPTHNVLSHTRPPPTNTSLRCQPDHPMAMRLPDLHAACEANITAVHVFVQLLSGLLSTAALALGEWRSRRQFAARAARRNPNHAAPGPPGEEDGASCLLPLTQLASVWLSLQVVAVVWHLCELLATHLA